MLELINQLAQSATIAEACRERLLEDATPADVEYIRAATRTACVFGVDSIHMGGVLAFVQEWDLQSALDSEVTA